jgi:hypothetical protein
MPSQEYYEPTDEFDRASDDFKVKKPVAELKALDKNYQKYTKLLNKKWTDGKFYKKAVIECHGSFQIGTRIRNACSGHYTNHLVGSLEEDLYFKVIDANARYGRSDPLFLFYDSPEQYENHQFIVLPRDVKEQWYNKNLEARQRQK